MCVGVLVATSVSIEVGMLEEEGLPVGGGGGGGGGLVVMETPWYNVIHCRSLRCPFLPPCSPHGQPRVRW